MICWFKMNDWTSVLHSFKMIFLGYEGMAKVFNGTLVKRFIALRSIVKVYFPAVMLSRRSVSGALSFESCQCHLLWYLILPHLNIGRVVGSDWKLFLYKYLNINQFLNHCLKEKKNIFLFPEIGWTRSPQCVWTMDPTFSVKYTKKWQNAIHSCRSAWKQQCNNFTNDLSISFGKNNNKLLTDDPWINVEISWSFRVRRILFLAETFTYPAGVQIFV